MVNLRLGHRPKTIILVAGLLLPLVACEKETDPNYLEQVYEAPDGSRLSIYPASVEDNGPHVIATMRLDYTKSENAPRVEIPLTVAQFERYSGDGSEGIVRVREFRADVDCDTKMMQFLESKDFNIKQHVIGSIKTPSDIQTFPSDSWAGKSIKAACEHRGKTTYRFTM